MIAFREENGDYGPPIYGDRIYIDDSFLGWASYDQHAEEVIFIARPENGMYGFAPIYTAEEIAAVNFALTVWRRLNRK